MRDDILRSYEFLDPDVVEAFLAVQDNFHATAISYADTEADIQTKIDYLNIAQIQR